jgi:hypothetical protein
MPGHQDDLRRPTGPPRRRARPGRCPRLCTVTRRSTERGPNPPRPSSSGRAKISERWPFPHLRRRKAPSAKQSALRRRPRLPEPTTKLNTGLRTPPSDRQEAPPTTGSSPQSYATASRRSERRPSAAWTTPTPPRMHSSPAAGSDDRLALPRASAGTPSGTVYGYRGSIAARIRPRAWTSPRSNLHYTALVAPREE